MIAKIVMGKSFSGASKYILGKERAKYLCGTMIGRTYPEIRQEIRFFEGIPSGIKSMSEDKTVFHESLNLAIGEYLEDSIWKDIVYEHMDKMGFGKSPWFAARHRDKPHDHVHVVALRVTLRDEEPVSDFDGDGNRLRYRCVDQEFNMEKAAYHLGQVASRYGLKKAPTKRMQYYEEHELEYPSFK